MKIQFQECDIKTIFAYFVDGFNASGSRKIHDYETNYDPRTGKVIFKLYIVKDESKAKKKK